MGESSSISSSDDDDKYDEDETLKSVLARNINKLARNSTMANSGEANTLPATRYPTRSSQDSERSSRESEREMGQAVQATKLEIFENSLFWMINTTPISAISDIDPMYFEYEKQRIWEKADEQEKINMHAVRKVGKLGLDPKIFPAENQPTRQNVASYEEKRSLSDKLQFKPLDPKSSPEDLYLWIFSEFLIYRKIALLINDNYVRLQYAKLTGDYISAVVLEPLNRAGRENVLELTRLSINDITAIM